MMECAPRQWPLLKQTVFSSWWMICFGDRRTLTASIFKKKNLTLSSIEGITAYLVLIVLLTFTLIPRVFKFRVHEELLF